VKPIPQFEPDFGPAEAMAVYRYMLGGGWVTEHTRTRAFEAAIAEYTGAKHCIAAPNGTLSLTMAALAVGLGRSPSHQVIVPDYTMVASANAMALAGAHVVFVDVDPQTLCMSLEAAKAALTPATRAVVLVAPNGRGPSEGIQAWVDWCRLQGLVLIEDAAQGLGSYVAGRHCGRWGAFGSFSFSVPKVISTGQGGCLITDSDEYAAELRRLKDFGRTGGGNDIHPTMGWNFKWTDLQACVGLTQLTKLAGRLERKVANGKLYAERLRGVPGVTLFEVPPGNVPWFYDGLYERRDELRRHLLAEGIGTRPMYGPIHQQGAWVAKGMAHCSGAYPVAERVGREGLWLPSSPQLTASDVHRVCDAIVAFYQRGA